MNAAAPAHEVTGVAVPEALVIQLVGADAASAARFAEWRTGGRVAVGMAGGYTLVLPADPETLRAALRPAVALLARIEHD